MTTLDEISANLPHLRLSVTSPYTFATCHARAWVMNVRLGTWHLEVQYDPGRGDKHFRGTGALLVTREALVHGRCSDLSAASFCLESAFYEGVHVQALLRGVDRDRLVVFAEHMWRKMRPEAARVRRHALMTRAADLNNGGFVLDALGVRACLAKIKLDEPARTV